MISDSSIKQAKTKKNDNNSYSLLCTRHCIDIILFSPHHNCGMKAILSLLFRRGNRGTECFYNFHKVAQLIYLRCRDSSPGLQIPESMLFPLWTLPIRQIDHWTHTEEPSFYFYVLEFSTTEENRPHPSDATGLPLSAERMLSLLVMARPPSVPSS